MGLSVNMFLRGGCLKALEVRGLRGFGGLRGFRFGGFCGVSGTVVLEASWGVPNCKALLA